MKNLLVIMAHPDDDILGCGATMSKLVEAGCNVRVVFVAEGTTCRQMDDATASREKEIRRRNEAGRSALESIGVRDVNFMDYPCGRLDSIPQLEINQRIEQEIRNFPADTIITHNEHDLNKDHRIVSHAVQIATRPGAFSYVERVLSCEVLSSSEWYFQQPFAPNYFEVIAKRNLDSKIAAFSCYVSETRDAPHPRSLAGIENLGKYRGQQINEEYAEAFHVLYWIAR